MPQGIYIRTKKRGGWFQTKESNESRRQKMLGRPTTEKMRLSFEKIKKSFYKGYTPWNKGLSAETDERIKIIVEKISGEKNYNWKGRNCSINTKIRKSNRYKTWRKEVFVRDNWTCQRCRKTRCELHPHHNKSLSEIIFKYNIQTMEQANECEELWDVKNGLTYCKECHKQTTAYGKNLKQIENV